MKRLVIGIVVLASLVATAVHAETPVDTELQSTMFKRIFSYDKHLRESERVVVILVSNDPSGDGVEDVAEVFEDNGLNAVVVSASQIDEELATHDPASTAIYVMEGVDYTSIKSLAAEKGLLTISGFPSLAMLGHVSVSVAMVGARAEVVVNMPRLQTEGHELSAELLKLARIIR